MEWADSKKRFGIRRPMWNPADDESGPTFYLSTCLLNIICILWQCIRERWREGEEDENFIPSSSDFPQSAFEQSQQTDC